MLEHFVLLRCGKGLQEPEPASLPEQGQQADAALESLASSLRNQSKAGGTTVPFSAGLFLQDGGCWMFTSNLQVLCEVEGVCLCSARVTTVKRQRGAQEKKEANVDSNIQPG